MCCQRQRRAQVRCGVTAANRAEQQATGGRRRSKRPPAPGAGPKRLKGRRRPFAATSALERLRLLLASLEYYRSAERQDGHDRSFNWLARRRLFGPFRLVRRRDRRRMAAGPAPAGKLRTGRPQPAALVITRRGPGTAPWWCLTAAK